MARLRTDNRPLGVIPSDMRPALGAGDDSVNSEIIRRAKRFIHDRVITSYKDSGRAAPLMVRDFMSELFGPVYGCMLPGGYDRSLFIEDVADSMSERGFDAMEIMRVCAELAAIGEES